MEDHEDPEQREEDRFLSCSPVLLSCVYGEELKLDSPFRGGGKTISPDLLVCPRAKPCGGYPLQVILELNLAEVILYRLSLELNLVEVILYR